MPQTSLGLPLDYQLKFFTLPKMHSHPSSAMFDSLHLLDKLAHMHDLYFAPGFRSSHLT
jgi:hypothetical protein